MKKYRVLGTEQLEGRRLLTASVGWDGPGPGAAELSYHIANSPDSLSDAQVEAAIELARKAWSDVADISFTKTDQAGQVDSLDISFASIDGRGGTLAQAYFPDDLNPAIIAGDIRFDAAETWEVGDRLGAAAFDLVAVAVHEIGHALGLEHSHSADSILRPTISANTQFVGLSADDIRSIQELYAPAMNPTIDPSPQLPSDLGPAADSFDSAVPQAGLPEDSAPELAPELPPRETPSFQRWHWTRRFGWDFHGTRESPARWTSPHWTITIDTFSLGRGSRWQLEVENRSFAPSSFGLSVRPLGLGDTSFLAFRPTILLIGGWSS